MKRWFRWRTVEYCANCGSAYVEHEYPDGFDRRTGQPKVYRTRECPRSNGLSSDCVILPPPPRDRD
jgi:hypothetical protein